MTAVASGLVVERARPGDDAELRRLLRENPMSGEVRVSLEREPSVWLAAATAGSRHDAVVARDPATGRIAGTGSRSVYDAWVGGEPCRLGYLSQLRVGEGGRGRRRLLAAGYAALGDRRAPDELPFDVTTIVADNRPARRLLGAGLAGLPRYRELERIVTLVLPTWPRLPRAPRRGLVVERGHDAALPELAAFLDREARRYQFAPRVSAELLRCPSRSRGLAPGDFLLARRDGSIVGGLAVWDQSAYKQVVVRGYAPRLARARPWLNLVARLLGGPRLPAPGEALRQAWLSPFAVAEDEPEVGDALLAAARCEAARRGCTALVLGLADRHSLRACVERRFRARRYDAVLCAVCWDGDAPLDRLDGRVPHLDVARL